jgi:hypothetical protein
MTDAKGWPGELKKLHHWPKLLHIQKKYIFGSYQISIVLKSITNVVRFFFKSILCIS